MLQKAVVAIEDSRFYEHDGVDLRGTLRALATNSQAGADPAGWLDAHPAVRQERPPHPRPPTRSAAAANEQSVSRKLQEGALAIGLEKRWTKQQILEGYLNIAYFGDGAYGAEAASAPLLRPLRREAHARRRPRRSPASSSSRSAFDPLRQPEVRRRPAATSCSTGCSTRSSSPRPSTTRPSRRRLDASLNPKVLRNGCSTSYAPYFCDYVYQVILNDPVFGKTPDDREALLKRGGLTIQTTLDPKIQKAAQKAVDEAIPRKDPSKKMAAAVFVQPGTGAILAMAQNRTWGVEKKLGVDLDQLHGRPEVQRHDRAAGRVDVQGLHARRGPREGHPGQRHRSTRPARRRSRRQLHELPGTRGRSTRRTRPHNSTGAGHVRHAQGHGLLGQHLLRGARAADRAVRDRAGRRVARRPYGSGQAARRRSRPSRSAPSTTHAADMAEAYATFAASGLHCDSRADRLDHRPRRARSSPCRPSAASRPSTARSPTA